MAFIRNVLVTATLATVSTTLATMFLGRREASSASAPLNATSHILWGDEAAEVDEFDFTHTVAGAIVNSGAMVAWAALQEMVLGRWVRKGPPVRAIAAGTATAATAYVTDYYVVPERLTPGFEKRLSPASLGAIYGVLAVALAIGVRLGKK